MKHKLITAVVFGMTGLVGTMVVGITIAADTPAPPTGYPSLVALKLAFAMGLIKPIDRQLPVPEAVAVSRAIQYGTGGTQPLKLDLYTPKGLDKPVPGLIFIHGGAWRKGARGDYHYYCVKFAERGYVVATISYRLTQTAPFPAAIEDAKCAVRWMRANAERLQVDPDQIGVVGGSAGGHLALMVGYSSDLPELEGNGGCGDASSRVQAVIDLYGPADLTTAFATASEEVIDFLNKQTYVQAPTSYQKASPIHHITKDDPPTLILHGTIDDIVPIAQSDALTGRLKETGVPFQYVRLEGWPHTMDLADDVNQYCRHMMTQFLDRYLPLPD